MSTPISNLKGPTHSDVDLQPHEPNEPPVIAPQLHKLRRFVGHIAALVESRASEAELLEHGALALRELVRVDDWLPDAYAQPSAERYQQYLLYADARERFSVVSFVWGPGQQTPIHDHTVWGLIGMLRGAECAAPYVRDKDGALRQAGDEIRLVPGDVEAVSPAIGDIHRVRNAYADRTSISIHVYGANIGAVRRFTYPPGDLPKPFISGYSNTTLPNLWDLSKESHHS
jgi:predicted metal-dependent enzyme (double-stranded beta helix superfamily)